MFPNQYSVFGLTNGEPEVNAYLIKPAAEFSETLRRFYGPTKINSAIFGNVVLQLNLNVVARRDGVEARPAPVCCRSRAVPLSPATKLSQIVTLNEFLVLHT